MAASASHTDPYPLPYDPAPPTLYQAELARLRHENQQIKARLRWANDVLGNSKIPSGQRITLYFTRIELEIQRQQTQTPGPQPVRIWKIAQESGQSPDGVGRHLDKLAQCGAWERDVRTSIDPSTSQLHSQVHLTPLPALEQPKELAPSTPNNWGGQRATCSACGSDQLVAETRIFCTECGTLHATRQRPLNSTVPQDVGQEPETATIPEQRRAGAPPTPAPQDAGHVNNLPGGGIPTGPNPVPQDAGREPELPTIPTQLNSNQEPPATVPQDAGRGAAYLAQVAGDGRRHIEMQSMGADKYQWRAGAVTPALAARHLRGAVTLGAELRQADGTTFALCWDTDTADGWQQLQRAAQQLEAANADPVLERSPAARGGHLWLFFREAVDSARARATAHLHAPVLATIGEAWPDPAGRRIAVRLPAGFYRRPGVAAWCALADADAAVWRTGVDAMALILGARMSTTWVMPLEACLSASPALPPPSLVINSVSAVARGMRSLPAAAHDPRWLEQYDSVRDRLYFWITDGEVAAWFNARHVVRDLLPPERNGYGLAVWRGERTASVRYTADNGWVDFGAGGLRADGRRDGGDVLELYCRLRDRSRADVLREAAREMVAVARRELEEVARAGRYPVAWVATVTSPAGWAYYDRCSMSNATEGLAR
jgi:hypothetical protein